MEKPALGNWAEKKYSSQKNDPELGLMIIDNHEIYGKGIFLSFPVWKKMLNFTFSKFYLILNDYKI